MFSVFVLIGQCMLNFLIIGFIEICNSLVELGKAKLFLRKQKRSFCELKERYYVALKYNFMDNLGFQFQYGLNKIEPFDIDDPEDKNKGIFFTTIDHIDKLFIRGAFVFEITIPNDSETVSLDESIFKQSSIDFNKNRSSGVFLTNHQYNIDDFIIKFNIVTHCALAWVSIDGSIESVKYLIDQGITKNVDTNYHGKHFAVKYGHLNIVQFLHENGTISNSNESYMICDAAENGYLDIVEYLVCNVIPLFTLRDIAIKYATRKGHIDIVKYLKNEIRNDSFIASMTNNEACDSTVVGQDLEQENTRTFIGEGNPYGNGLLRFTFKDTKLDLLNRNKEIWTFDKVYFCEPKSSYQDYDKYNDLVDKVMEYLEKHSFKASRTLLQGFEDRYNVGSFYSINKNVFGKYVSISVYHNFHNEDSTRYLLVKFY
jgi:hypothetical protein